jgi:PAS domain
MADEKHISEATEVYAAAPPPSSAPKIRALHAYWRSIHPPAGGLPGRQHFDPIDIPALLPWLWLIDVQREPLRFKHRLVGTEHVRVMKRDPTGQWLDQAYPLFVESETYPQFVAASDGQSGYRRGQPLFHLPREFLSMEHLLLPLAQDGVTVGMILAITIYHPRV